MCIRGILVSHVYHLVSNVLHQRGSGMSSDNRYKPPRKVQPGDIYEVFRKLDEPVLSTTDFNREIDWASRSTVHRRLKDMRESGELRSKKGGKHQNAGEVWYPDGEIEDIPPATPDPIRLIYRYPWFSLLTTGFFIIGLGFMLFLPGFFGEGRYLGVIAREWMVRISLIFYFSGVIIVLVASVVIISRQIASWQIASYIRGNN